MSANIKIYCKNTNQYVDVTGGDTLQQLYNTLQPQVGEGMIAARVNNKTKDLQYPIFGPKQVEFIGIDTASGMRVYIHSLCMILYKAITTSIPVAGSLWSTPLAVASLATSSTRSEPSILR